MDKSIIDKEVRLRCSRCGEEYPFRFLLKCSACGGLVDPVYDLENVVFLDSHRPLERYFYLTPLQKRSSVFYFGEGNTPCIHAQQLGRKMGLERLYLKDETRNRTGTTKDRMAACVLSYFHELGINEFVACSTGNSSTALALGAQSIDEVHLHLFCARSFLHRHNYYNHPRIHLHIVDGDFVYADKVAQQFAEENNIVFEGGFFDLARREGLKLAYLEAFDQMAEEPAVIVQAVSSGMGVYGAYRGIREYQALGKMKGTPRLVCVQQDTCAPMYRAYTDKSNVIRPSDIFHNPSGIAEAILRGNPSQTYPYLYDAVQETGGCFAIASQSEIEEMKQWLFETEGIDACYSSATALAATYHLIRHGWIDPTEIVLVNITGIMRYSSVDALTIENTIARKNM